jgi:hypothetical protein
MNSKENEMTEAVNQTPDSKEENMDLSINDLNAMKVIIDIASSRGAFKPNEMAVVGQTYNKLTGFLDNVAKQAEAQKLAKAEA